MTPEDFELTNWDKAKNLIQKRVSWWESEELVRTRKRRDLRKVDLDVEARRQSGEIMKDETFIPVRIIDTNIRQAKPKFMNYLRQSQRLVVFTPIHSTTKLNLGKLEEAFSTGMKYLNWDIAFERGVDGMLTHGWNFMQVVYDTTKPLHVAVKYIPHERVLLPAVVEDFQSVEFVLVQHDFTPQKLFSFVEEFQFDAAAVAKLTEQSDPNKQEDLIKIYQMFFKKNKVVWMAWCSPKCDIWLTQPAPLDLGMQSEEQVQELVEVPIQDPLTGVVTMVEQPQTVIKMVPMEMTEYPLIPIYFDESEDPNIVSRKGRVFYDHNKQEAATSLSTSFVNASRRASNLYPYREIPGQGAFKFDDKVVLTHGKLANEKLGFYQLNYPSPQLLEGLQYMFVQNANEIGDMTFAVQNKQNSRTTAKEVQSAEADSALITSAQLIQFSRAIQTIYTYVWLLVQNYAQTGRVLLVPSAENPLVNDPVLINTKYIVKPAGDVDYIKREELKALFQQFWPVIQTTPIAGAFLAKMIRLFFVDDGEEFAQQLEAGNPANIVAALLELVKSQMTTENLQSLPPETAQKLIQIMQQAEQYVQSTGTAELATASNNPGTVSTPSNQAGGTPA